MCLWLGCMKPGGAAGEAVGWDGELKVLPHGGEGTVRTQAELRWACRSDRPGTHLLGF